MLGVTSLEEIEKDIKLARRKSEALYALRKNVAPSEDEEVKALYNVYKQYPEDQPSLKDIEKYIVLLNAQKASFLASHSTTDTSAPSSGGKIQTSVPLAVAHHQTDILSFVMAEKPSLPLGSVAAAYGAVMARSHTIKALHNGLAKLAQHRGAPNLDKKEVPLLAIGACSGAGKTEFLRWVFNECCSFTPQKGAEVDQVLSTINNSSPASGAPALTKMVVLFASFNQGSTFKPDDEPFVEPALAERLLRSTQGSTTFNAALGRRYNTNSIAKAIDMVTGKDPSTGVILCVDELLKLSEDNRRKLLDVLLLETQNMLCEGRFVAVIATSLQLFTLGEMVMSGSQRPIHPLPLIPSEEEQQVVFKGIEEKAREIISDKMHEESSADKVRHEFQTEVALAVLRHSEKMEQWGCFPKLATGSTNVPVAFDTYNYKKLEAHNVTPEQFFRIVACSWCGTPVPLCVSVDVDRHLAEVLTSQFNARAVLPPHGCDWEQLEVHLHLPPWRLLQVISSSKDQAFPQIDNWVLSTLRHLFYQCTTHEELIKYWELGTMAALDLRRAMLCTAATFIRDTDAVPPSVTLRDVLPQGAITNVSDELLNIKASMEPTTLVEPPRLANSTAHVSPAIYHSGLSNEPAVEGFVTGFEDVLLFYQMKLYTTATTAQIINWLNTAHARVTELGYGEQQCLVLLFVTGTNDDRVRTSLKNKVKKNTSTTNEKKKTGDLPPRSIVLTTKAISNLFQPFGSGAIQTLVDSKKRGGSCSTEENSASEFFYPANVDELPEELASKKRK